MDINAGAAQNAGRYQYIYHRNASATVLIIGIEYTSLGLTSAVVSYVGVTDGVSIAPTDTAMSFTVDQVGVKNTGDGTNIDINATSGNNTTEETTAILANQGSGTSQSIQIYVNGSTSVKWYNVGGNALATHSTSIPTYNTETLFPTVATTQSMRIIVSGMGVTVED